MHTMIRICRWAMPIFAALCFDAAPLLGQDVFTVNTYTTAPQSNPKLVADRDGGFFVAWTSGRAIDFNAGPDGNHRGIRGRRFDASGDAIGDEFTINKDTGGDEDIWQLSSNKNGRFVVSYFQNLDPVYGSIPTTTRYNTIDADNFIGPSSEADSFSAIAMGESGQFMVSNGSRDDVRLNRFFFDGTPLGDEIIVDPEEGLGRTMAVTPDNGFVVVWTYSFSPHVNNVLARRFDSNGLPEGPEIDVNSTMIGFASSEETVILRDGGFAVVWHRRPGEGKQLLGQVFNRDGSKRGEEFEVNTFQTDVQIGPRIAADPVSGGFAVVWQRTNPEDHPDDDQPRILARRFSAAGEPLASEFTASVGTETERSILGYDAIVDDNGNLITVWGQWSQPANVLGTRIASPIVFQDNFESEDFTAWTEVFPGPG